MASVLLRHPPTCTGRTRRRARFVSSGKHTQPPGLGLRRFAERIMRQGMMRRASSARTLTSVAIRRLTP
jgi:hypothetical protein